MSEPTLHEILTGTSYAVPANSVTGKCYPNCKKCQFESIEERLWQQIKEMRKEAVSMPNYHGVIINRQADAWEAIVGKRPEGKP